ncbi:MAG TPA: hypothetical protein PKC39_15325 [Ferruginibacter sp.]|nr:hypothetical protein [Ferruginibacter sp.]HMP22329.1 hypothetical protein [Ferruginibacter sp.]
MEQVEILVTGRHPQIMDTVLRLINQHGNWNASGALSDEVAIELFQQRAFRLVLLCSGISEESEKKLRALFTFQNPGIIIVQHYGGGSGLLTCEIQEALDKAAAKNKPVVQYKDGLL